MKFSCYSSDRTSWILEIAQDWMKNQISTDINVVCVDAEKVTNYQCHKLIISSFFETELPRVLIDDTEEIIVTDESSRQFQLFYKSVMDLDTKEEAWKASFEQDSPNENVIGNFANFLENIETKKDKLADIKKEISGLEEEEDLYDFNDDEDYDYDKVDDDVEIEKLYDVKKEHDQTITDIEKLLENEENSVTYSLSNAIARDNLPEQLS